MRVCLIVAISFALSSASCASSSSPTDGTPLTAPRSVTKMVGAEGATIEVDGAVVTFPTGALSDAKAITIQSINREPEGFVVLSRVFECQPSGTSFAKPVTMTMPFADDGQGPVTMFWSSGSDPTFKDIGGKPVDGKITATVMHFSEGFVGRKKAPR